MKFHELCQLIDHLQLTNVRLIFLPFGKGIGLLLPLLMNKSSDFLRFTL